MRNPTRMWSSRNVVRCDQWEAQAKKDGDPVHRWQIQADDIDEVEDCQAPYELPASPSSCRYSFSYED